LLCDGLTGSFMLGPGPEDVALLGHAGTVAGVSNLDLSAIATPRTGRFGVLESLLKLGVSLATLAVNASPNLRLTFGHATVRADGAAYQRDGRAHD
jgi:hypothetical protein